jgi:hypothetical protein
MPRAPILLPLTIAAAACGVAAAALADDDDYPTWKPSSAAAAAVTGPILLLPDRLKVGPVYLPWRADGVLPRFKPDQGPIPARVFALTDPANPALLNGKTLCGGDTVNWIVMAPAPPNGLEIDAFSGADKPSSISSPGLCGTFSYTRW